MPKRDAIGGKRPVGRPTLYNADIAELICNRLIGGESLRTICRDEDMPTAGTVCLWLTKHIEFSEQYARAREAQTEAMGEDCLVISDDGSNDTYVDENGNTRTDRDVIQRSKLRVETRFRLMAAMNPRKYGMKADPPPAAPVVNQYITADLQALKRYATMKIIEHDPQAKLLPKE